MRSSGNATLLTRLRQKLEWIYGAPLISDFKMQYGIAAGLTAHICNLLASGDRITLMNAQCLIIGVGAQIVIIMFQNDQLTVVQQTASRSKNARINVMVMIDLKVLIAVYHRL